MNLRKGFVLVFLFTLTSLAFSTSKADTGLNYYPASIMNRVLSGSLDSKSATLEVRRILTSAHKIHSNGEQTLEEHCGSNDCFKHQSLGYKEARRFLFGQLHLEGNRSDGYSVRGVYCRREYTSGSNAGSVGPKQIPNSNVLNCEHTWPQSRFSRRFSKSTQKGDLHHLFPTGSRINSTRGNSPFGEVSYDKDVYCSEARYGISDLDGGNNYFEPAAEHQGNVARAVFYFALRYQLKIGKVEEFYLRKWHEADPVDFEEQLRNNQIEDIQGNRNPFIDYPSLTDHITDL